MSSTTVRSSAERLVLALLLLLLVGCPAGDAPTDGPDELTDPPVEVDPPAEDPGATEQPEDAGEAIAAADAPAEEPVDPDGAPDGADGEPQRAELAATAPQGTDAITALLAGYEAGVPTAEQLRAASPDPQAVLLTLSKDETQRPAVRQAAVRTLGVLGGADAVQQLTALLADASGDPGLRRAAVQGAQPLLGDDPGLRAGVQARLRDETPAVARAAVLALADVPAARDQLVTLDGEDVPPQVKTALDDVLRGGTEPKPPTATKVEPAVERTPGRR